MLSNHYLSILKVLTLALLLTSCSTKMSKLSTPKDVASVDMGSWGASSGKIGPTSPDWMMAHGGVGIYKLGKPYKVNGIWYFPKEDYKYDEIGIASWYGPDFHQKKTANGEIFDMNLVSAAHKTLPLPSVVRVTNLSNGRSLIVRVNDRGPFVNDRLIDLSRKAAQLLGFIDKGTTKVRVELLPEESMTVASLAQGKLSRSSPSVGLAVPQDSPASSGQIIIQDNAMPTLDPNPVQHTVLATSASAEKIPMDKKSKVQSNEMMDITGEIESKAAAVEQHLPEHVAPSPDGNIYIQIGAYAHKENAQRVVQKLSHIGDSKIAPIRSGDRTLYRVRLGPLDDTAEAKAVLQKIVESGHSDARVLMN